MPKQTAAIISMLKTTFQKLQKIKITTSPWDLSNQILYEICQKYPYHKDDGEIITKVLMIGRVYSAAIERRKNVESSSSLFYLKKVAPNIRKSNIDIWLDTLRGLDYPTLENCSQIIAIHKKVTDLFEQISGLEKRSLASKYLHFHFPYLFFIYDSRSLSAIRRNEKNVFWNPNLVEYDYAYAKFFLRCMAFVEKANDECGIYLTPRELDKYLLLD